MKMAACGLLKFTSIIRAISLVMEAASTSETSVNFYQSVTTQNTAIFVNVSGQPICGIFLSVIKVFN
jgi:hypothetical protein